MAGGKLTKPYLAVVSLLAWSVLITQMYVSILSDRASVGVTIYRYFSYFTLLSNMMVAICATAIVLAHRDKINSFWQRPRTTTAIAIYIAVVGLIYNIVLRQLWAPQGIQRLLDESEHSILPVLFVLYWIIGVSKRGLQWSYIPAWLIYPAVYAVAILVMGSFSGFYPYPFVDVTKYGYNTVLINCGWVVVLFLVFSLLAVGIGKLINKSSPRNTV